MLKDILIPFVVVGLAELGDKTQIAVFCLSSKTKKYLQLLLGVILGFALADGLAILLGDFITKIVPLVYIKTIAGIIFIIFGILTLLKKNEKEEKCELKTPFISSFLLIFVSELGDKTQISAGLFATEYNPFFVFIGVMAALILLSIMAIYLGKIIVQKVNRKTVSIVAGSIFIIIGIITIISASGIF